mmetsp:Transcript_25867/g.41611  ORF Transcript_25867/g.41611 Transcript_25867/m.41611 type:complete len:89 (-) Transcript_25867:12-278(-)
MAAVTQKSNDNMIATHVKKELSHLIVRPVAAQNEGTQLLPSEVYMFRKIQQQTKTVMRRRNGTTTNIKGERSKSPTWIWQGKHHHYVE